MLINDVIKKIDASYNTVRTQIKKNNQYYEYKNKILHVTDLGYIMLEEKYGLKAEILSDEDINFYKGQLKLLQRQLEIQMTQFENYQIQIEQQNKLNLIYQKEIENQTLLRKEQEKKVENLYDQIKKFEEETFFEKFFRKKKKP